MNMATKKNEAENAQELEQTGTETTEQNEQPKTPEDTGNTEQPKAPEAEQDAAAEVDEFSDLPNPCVYCGPSVRGVARQYTTYQGGIPKELKAFLQAHPAAKRLIVPTSQFAGIRKKLETHGTAEEIVYKKVKSEL
jgi:hypothetical protein